MFNKRHKQLLKEIERARLESKHQFECLMASDMPDDVPEKRLRWIFDLSERIEKVVDKEVSR